MKKLLLFLFFNACIFAFAGGQESRFTLYAGMGGATLDGAGVASLDLKLGYAALPWLNIGVQGTAYHTLEREYKDAEGNPYQAEAGLFGLFFQPHWELSEKIDLGVKIATGMQTVQLRYMGSLRDNLVYYEEYLDRLNIPYNDLGVTLEYRFCTRHSLQLEAGYRHSHPAKSPYLEHDMEGTFYGSIFYGISLD